MEGGKRNVSSRNSFGKMLINNNVEKFRLKKDFLKPSQLRSVSKVMIFTVDELHRDVDEVGYEITISYSCPDCLDEVKEYIE